MNERSSRDHMVGDRVKDFSFWSCGTGKKHDVKNTAAAQCINSYPCTGMIP